MNTAIEAAPSTSGPSPARRTWTAADLLIERDALSADLTCGEALKRFELPHAPPSYAVNAGGKFGLIDRVALASMLAQQFGRALFERKKIVDVMDRDPLVVESAMTIHEIGEAIADSKPEALQTCFIITDSGRYLGIGMGLDLLRLTAEHAQEMLARLKSTQESLIRSEKLASLGRLVAGVAHEINTPVGITVTAATQFADVLGELTTRVENASLRRSDLDRFLAMSAETTRLILANVERTAELVRSFKRIAMDQSTDERRSFELRSCLSDLLESMRPQLQRFGHSLELSCPDGIVIDGYPGPISQVIANLLNNALAHAFARTDGGHIWIRVALDDCEVIQLCFIDDGRGIPLEDQQRVFEPFFTTARAVGGSGLGLSIIHNIVTHTLGGAITVESSPGNGTRFSIRFPRVAPTDNGGGARTAARFGARTQ